MDLRFARRFARSLEPRDLFGERASDRLAHRGATPINRPFYRAPGQSSVPRFVARDSAERRPGDAIGGGASALGSDERSERFVNATLAHSRYGERDEISALK